MLAYSGTLLSDIVQHGRLLELSKGTILLQTGAPVQYIPLLTQGSLKVLRSDDQAHEVLLYRILPGESCAFTLASAFRRETSKVKAIADQHCTVLLIPVELNDQLARRYPLWFEFVLDAYNKRMEELLVLVEDLGFKSLEERLEKYLRDRFHHLQLQWMPVAHQEIADDLGTSRVVISRMLKQMEKKGRIALGRGRIKNIQLM